MTYDLREAILDTATDLFMKNGYQGTTTREISKILNVTQPAIYHHFKTKEQLYIEVLIRYSTSSYSVLSAILDKKQPYDKTLLDMAQFLQEQQPMNLPLMMHDIEYSLSEESQVIIFKIWSENFLSPFVSYFTSIESFTSINLSPQNLSSHFLRILSSYISDSEYNRIERERLEEIVLIFLNGITK